MLLLSIPFLHLFPGTEDNMGPCFLILRIPVTNPVGRMSTCQAVWVGEDTQRPAYNGNHYNVQVYSGVIGEKDE